MRTVSDNILNIKLQKKFKDRIRNVYPVTHGDNVLLGNPGSELCLTDKMDSIDNILGKTDFSKYTPDISSGMKSLFESINSLVDALNNTKNGNILIRSATLLPDDWVEDSDKGIFKTTLTSAYIKSNDVVNVYFDSTSIDEANRCGVETYYWSDGELVVKSTTKPTTNISFRYILIKNFTSNCIPESFEFYECITTKNEDGSILKTYDFGTLLITENVDGNTTEVFTDLDGNTTTKTTTVSDDGSITEIV